MRLVRKMDDKLWEVRIDLPTDKIARVLFTTIDKEMVLLHGFIKKSQETPQSDLDLSKKRRDEVHNEQAKQKKAKPKARRK